MNSIIFAANRPPSASSWVEHVKLIHMRNSFELSRCLISWHCQLMAEEQWLLVQIWDIMKMVLPPVHQVVNRLIWIESYEENKC